MSFLSPWALLGLLSVPVLLWLWRLSATRRHVHVPSLIPFEHLLRRQPRRRRHLVVNGLFWLQLAALAGLALALAQPVLFQRRASTTLVILDTSASMAARWKGSNAFEHARRALLERVERKGLADQLFLMTTAPAAPVLPSPTNDAGALRRAVHAIQVTHLGGNLSTAAHIGRSLLRAAPDETWVVTDEPAPAGQLPDNVRWLRVGGPAPNVAIVGLDAQGSLCTPADARIVVTVQNFSNEPTQVTVTATKQSDQVASAGVDVAARARTALPLALPLEAAGELEVTLDAQGDALDVDNHAWLDLHQSASLPIVVHARRSSLTEVVSAWLGACQALRWQTGDPTPHSPYLLITDDEEEQPAVAAAIMRFSPPPSQEPVPVHWVVSADHPIGSYLAPVEVVAAPVNLSAGLALSGTPVVSGLIRGRRAPLVVADERDGRRLVWMLFDPSGHRDSTPIILTFFNSLRWLMGHAQTALAGEPLTVAGLKPGTVEVQRPDGSMDMVDAEGDLISYQATTFAGRYRFRGSRGSSEAAVAVNFFNPLESNLIDRSSTWRAVQAPGILTGTASPKPVAHERRGGGPLYPLASLVMMVLLCLLVIEWRLYSAKRMSP